MKWWIIGLLNLKWEDRHRNEKTQLMFVVGDYCSGNGNSWVTNTKIHGSETK